MADEDETPMKAIWPIATQSHIRLYYALFIIDYIVIQHRL
jgi:hypothetical protein